MCVRSWLDRQFPGRWIGRRGPLEWPPRSPDLTSTLFLLVGGIWRSWCTSWKYSYLKERNRDECARITPDMLKGFRHEWERLIRMCYKCNGPHIEHVLLIKRPFSPIYLDSWITCISITINNHHGLNVIDICTRDKEYFSVGFELKF